MTEKVSWQDRIKDSSPRENIEAKITDRLQYLEGELHKRGIKVMVGAEQKFFLLDKQGKPCDIDIRKLRRPFKNSLPMIESFRRGAPKGKYEIIFGSRGHSYEFPSIMLAEQVLLLRKELKDGSFEFRVGKG